MKKLCLAVVLVCFFVTFNADARNLACPTEESLAIDKLEQELNNCKVDYGDNASTADNPKNRNNNTYQS